MNKNKLKSYAPAARRDFIQAVTERAHFWGLSEKQVEPIKEDGNVAIIGGRPFPRKFAAQRRRLEERVKREGFNQVMEAVAYTWFNRFLAIRFMELHGYLEHGFRVLSNPSGSPVPEILEHAAQVDLPGLNKQTVVELKLDGTKDAELYRMLLVAQCNALYQAMPFLFERIDDETELLLPDNLLHSDSLIRKLVTSIDEEDWQEVEIIGWLYQFYISEKKDQVIGKVVKSEDIPAATQLFTPNWIVKYMVQNSLGRKWLATYPNSPLRQKMEYYIEPAEQTEEVVAQLQAITPESINPETLTLLDPAAGSGHILVEAYDLLKEIYLERGYSPRDFPRLILEKNLYGLDIDDRAAQMAGFALLMKARKDDRRILRSDNPVKMNVMAIQGSGGLDSVYIANSMLDGVKNETHQLIVNLVEVFRHGKTFGSLITIPENIAKKLDAIAILTDSAIQQGDIFSQQAAFTLSTMVCLAKILSNKYDAVVANPPYMGEKFYNPILKEYIKLNYSEGYPDIYGCFIKRNIAFSRANSRIGMITIPNWMFNSTFEDLREDIINNYVIENMVNNGRGIWGSDFGSCVFVISKSNIEYYKGNYKKLYIKPGSVTNLEVLQKRFFEAKTFACSSSKFQSIPGKPIAFWLNDEEILLYKKGNILGNRAEPRKGLDTGENDKFLRLWWEIAFSKFTPDNDQQKKWFPYNKGGDFKKWYGNREYVINWENGGAEIKSRLKLTKKKPTLRNQAYYFKEGYCWTTVTMAGFSARYTPPGALFDNGGCTLFSDKNIHFYGALLNSVVADRYFEFLSPSVNFQPGDVAKILVVDEITHDNIEQIVKNATSLVSINKQTWDFYEVSWDFKAFPLIRPSSKTIENSFANFKAIIEKHVENQMFLESQNNEHFIHAYGLSDELSPNISKPEVTITGADQQADMKRLISYAIGCMMGRYNLDEPGLAYASSGNIGFDHKKYKTFPADDDGIVPVMDMEWFPDDAATRFEEFLKVAWPPEALEENLKFVADSLGPKGAESPRETIRRYLYAQFYKDHLQSYKKRPIYWLFSSGKEQAFECLVYLHRYNEATLSRMRNEYVTPLIGKFSARATYLDEGVKAASSTAERNRLQKELDTIKKKQVELASFDELLRHYADHRISLDLDNGVKVNYGKFGNLLADVKAVTGGKEN